MLRHLTRLNEHILTLKIDRFLAHLASRRRSHATGASTATAAPTTPPRTAGTTSWSPGSRELDPASDQVTFVLALQAFSALVFSDLDVE